jgi:hypothetical protein
MFTPNKRYIYRSNKDDFRNGQNCWVTLSAYDSNNIMFEDGVCRREVKNNEIENIYKLVCASENGVVHIYLDQEKGLYDVYHRDSYGGHKILNESHTKLNAVDVMKFLLNSFGKGF